MYEYRAVIRSVHDGDSIRADIDLGFGIWTANQPLRLYGLDAPELGTDEGRAAREWLRGVLPIGHPVTIRTIRDQDDKYGRLLALVFDADHILTSINTAMIDAGHARHYDGGPR